MVVSSNCNPITRPRRDNRSGFMYEVMIYIYWAWQWQNVLSKIGWWSEMIPPLVYASKAQQFTMSVSLLRMLCCMRSTECHLARQRRARHIRRSFVTRGHQTATREDVRRLGQLNSTAFYICKRKCYIGFCTPRRTVLESKKKNFSVTTNKIRRSRDHVISFRKLCDALASATDGRAETN